MDVLNVAEELWVTVQAASCFCHLSHFLKVACLHFLLIQLILFHSWVSEGVEVIAFLVYKTQKRNSLKRCKVYKVERHQKIVLDGNTSYDRK